MNPNEAEIYPLGGCLAVACCLPEPISSQFTHDHMESLRRTSHPSEPTTPGRSGGPESPPEPIPALLNALLELCRSEVHAGFNRVGILSRYTCRGGAFGRLRLAEGDTPEPQLPVVLVFLHVTGCLHVTHEIAPGNSRSVRIPIFHGAVVGLPMNYPLMVFEDIKPTEGTIGCGVSIAVMAADVVRARRGPKARPGITDVRQPIATNKVANTHGGQP